MDIVVAVESPHARIVGLDGEDVGDAFFDHDCVAAGRIFRVGVGTVAQGSFHPFPERFGVLDEVVAWELG